MKLTKNDEQMIEMAKDVLLANKDLYEKNEILIASIVKTTNGNFYKGINIMTSHSICSEQIALGQALTCGERNFDTLVAVKLENDGTMRVISPCGLCRYTMDKLGYDINVIVEDVDKDIIVKVNYKELLPYPYKRDNEDI